MGTIRIVKKWEKNGHVRMVVHDGIFHADDVLCVALAGVFMSANVDVIRTRDENIIEESDICCDVKHPRGNVYYPWCGGGIIFDHHTVEKDANGNDARKRYPSTSEGQPGILYSAVSHFFEWATNTAVFEEGELFFNSKTSMDWMPEAVMDHVKEAIIVDRLIKPVACQDNGQELNDYGIKSNPLSFVSYMNPVCENETNTAFMKCVDMAIEIYRSISEHADKTVEDRQELVERFENIEDNLLRYLEMDEYLDDWIEKVIEYNDKAVVYNDGFPTILCSVFKGKVKGWNLQMVPKAKGSFDIWHEIPEFIKEGEGGCTFVHAARWLAAFNTKEEALAAAKKIVEFFS